MNAWLDYDFVQDETNSERSLAEGELTGWETVVFELADAEE